MQLAIFDLDHTLMPFDSDKAWIQYLVDIDAVDADDYETQNARFYQDYLDAKLDIREYSRFACQVLQKFPLKQVEKWRDEYIRSIVMPEIQSKAIDCVAAYKIEGFTTMIISATNTFIVEPIAALHGVDAFLGCEFEVINGRYTGELVGVPTYREGKIEALKIWLAAQGAKAETIHFYSDSINDKPLLEYADKAFVVDPDQALAEVAHLNDWPVVRFSD